MKLSLIAIAFLLAASTVAASSVVLHWDYGTTPGITFNVYRNGYRIASGVTLHKYKDGHPKIGKNHYVVTADEDIRVIEVYVCGIFNALVYCCRVENVVF